MNITTSDCSTLSVLNLENTHRHTHTHTHTHARTHTHTHTHTHIYIYILNICHAKRKGYHSKLRNFLNYLEADKIKNLCNAANCNEKLFWKLLKGQKSFSKMSAFLVNGNLLTDRNLIRNMWADHFEALGTPSENWYFDKAFLNHVVCGVREIFDSCTNSPFGILCEPLDYDEVACVCSKLKRRITGLCIDYKHIHFAGPPMWRLLFELYRNFYANGSVCESLKTGHSSFI